MRLRTDFGLSEGLGESVDRETPLEGCGVSRRELFLLSNDGPNVEERRSALSVEDSSCMVASGFGLGATAGFDAMTGFGATTGFDAATGLLPTTGFAFFSSIGDCVDDGFSSACA